LGDQLAEGSRVAEALGAAQRPGGVQDDRQLSTATGRCARWVQAPASGSRAARPRPRAGGKTAGTCARSRTARRARTARAAPGRTPQGPACAVSVRVRSTIRVGGVWGGAAEPVFDHLDVAVAVDGPEHPGGGLVRLHIVVASKARWSRPPRRPGARAPTGPRCSAPPRAPPATRAP